MSALNPQLDDQSLVTSAATKQEAAPPTNGEVGEGEVNDGSPYVGKRIAVKEEKRCTAMALPQKSYGFVEGGDFCLAPPLLCFKRCIAL
jgi:hypothetical protein